MAAYSYSVRFISRDSRLQFGSLNHANLDAFNTERAFPRLPDNRTYGGHRESDAIDLSETLGVGRFHQLA
jgi:hypothetical protein